MTSLLLLVCVINDDKLTLVRSGLYTTYCCSKESRRSPLPLVSIFYSWWLVLDFCEVIIHHKQESGNIMQALYVLGGRVGMPQHRKFPSPCYNPSFIAHFLWLYSTGLSSLSCFPFLVYKMEIIPLYTFPMCVWEFIMVCTKGFRSTK